MYLFCMEEVSKYFFVYGLTSHLDNVLAFYVSVGCLARRMYAEKRETLAAIFLQKYVRGWLSRIAYLQLYSSAIVIQSCIRGFSDRQRFLFGKEYRAATLIQVQLLSNHSVSFTNYSSLCIWI